MIIFFAYGILGCAIINLLFKRFDYAIKGLAIQGVLLALIAAAMGLETGSSHYYAATALTIAVKVMLIPWILLRILRAIDFKLETEKQINKQIKLLIILAIISFSYYVASFFSGAFAINQGDKALPVAISIMLFGLFLMISCHKTLMQVAGFITLENGLFLLGIVLTQGMPLLVDIGIFLNFLIAVIIMGVFSVKMKEQFNSLDLEQLRNLRG